MTDNKSPLVSLKTDLTLFNDLLKEVALEMIENKLTKYPVFLAHQHESKVGEVLVSIDESGSEWNIHVSTFEDFCVKKIITPDKEDYFLSNFKDPTKFMCVLVVVPEGANFVFVPY